MTDVVQIKRRRKTLPRPPEMTLACEVFGLPMPSQAAQIGFTMQRTRDGTIVGLQQDGHWWNLSHMTGRYPPSFKEARKWVAAYASGFGQDLREMKYDRSQHEWVFK